MTGDNNRNRPAPPTLVEALVYSCRRGPGALERPDNLRRLGELDKWQLEEMHGRVQRFRPNLQYEGRPAVRWTAEEADTLLDKWIASNGNKR